jgi:adenosylcobinamide kinase/adenosylcobinamide-phosphate guanylyltransferase
MEGLTLLLGGARSGKSATAAAMGSRWDGPVVVIATGEERDEEMAERIARHRRERPAEWLVLEEPVDLAGMLNKAPADACAIVDCLTLWVSNLMEQDLDDDAIAERAKDAAALAAGRAGPTIVISNEVGLGIVPMNATARRYRDLLGRVNALWADAATHAALVVAGRLLPLERT